MGRAFREPDARTGRPFFHFRASASLLQRTFRGKKRFHVRVEGITGYVLDDQGQPVAIVTILVNGCIHLLPSARSLVDKMVLEAVTFYAGGN